MKRIIYVTLVVAALVAAWGSAASADDQIVSEGPYVSLAGGVAGTKLMSNGTSVGGLITAKVGVPILEQGAIELHLDWIPEDDGFITTIQQRIPLFFDFGRFQPYAIVGLGGAYIGDARKAGRGTTTFAARGGGGIDFSVTDQIFVGIDVSHVFLAGGLVDYTAFSFGARYGF